MKKIFSISLIVLGFIFTNCEEEAANPALGTLDFVEGLRVVDFGNAGNPSDIVLLYTILNPADANQVHLFINKGPDISFIDREDVDISSPDRFYSLELSGTTYETTLPASMKDIQGNPIEKDTEYTIGFLITAGGEMFINKESEQMILQEIHFLTGDYTGTWDDNLYTAFGISTRINLNLSGGRASGEFFYSSTFSSCCEGVTDGTISFILKENGNIEDFIYRQDLANFQGGQCTGTYTGSGVLENYTTLLIDFTGEDCEGPHTGGKIRLQKKR